MSSQQLCPETVNYIERLLRATRRTAPQFQMHLELTERVFLGDFDTNASLINQIRELGVTMAIDDFGTGYSSLDYLRRLPVDTLKIDGSFIKEMQPNDQSSELVRTMIQLGRNLGMDVIAEKLETRDQLTQLRQMRCEFAQGRFFSGPVDAETSLCLANEGLAWSFACPTAADRRSFPWR